MWKKECSKFKANIFNKQKCANCFKTREQHSQDALEFNRLTRVVSKCGYLFVAPNWDFSNPVYRTKRWQRRWFILYEDGELTYSVDDHVDTIPQAIINLNTVFEITEADAITGNENSIAIVANDGIHFVKGACCEESRLWRDILRLFPQAAGQTRQTVGGTGSRAKRSATFPGLRSLGGSSGGAAAQQQRLQMVAATNNYNQHLNSQAEPYQNKENDSKSDNVDGREILNKSGKACYDDSGLPPTPPTTSPPDSSPENSPALKTKKISESGVKSESISSKQFGQASILKNSHITTSTPTTSSPFNQSTSGIASVPPTLKKSLSTLSPSVVLESNNLINESERYRDTSHRKNNNVNYKSPYQKYERSNTSETSNTSERSFSTSFTQSSASNMLAEKKNMSPFDESLNNGEMENGFVERIRTSCNKTSFSSVSRVNTINSTVNTNRTSMSSPHNFDHISKSNATEDPMEENTRNISSIGSRISCAMNRKQTSLSWSPYSGLSGSTSLTTPSISNNNSRRSTSLLSSLPPPSSSVMLPASSPIRNTALPQQSQSVVGNISNVHKNSITNPMYLSNVNNNSSLDEEILPDPPTESRGAPDGCGLDIPPEILNKKGWLMKQGLTKEWHKYWFVLQDVALLYYRDPKAESKGFLDGIIDLSQVQRIDKQELPRHFGFYIKTYEGKTIVFSAITDGIRKNWIASLQKAANVGPTSADDSNDDSCNNNNSGNLAANMRKRSSINEMDVITTTRIVRASTTTPPSLTKVPSLPPPLTLQTSTTTMTFSTDVFDDEDDDDTTDEDDEEDSEDYDDESEDEMDAQCLSENTDKTNPERGRMQNNEDDNIISSKPVLDDRSSTNLNNADGVLVDLLETEVDSLKAQLEKTQSELYSLHHSNISRGHSTSSSSHSSLQSMAQQQQYIVPSSNNNSLSSNNMQQPVQSSQQSSQQIQQQQTTSTSNSLSSKRYTNNNLTSSQVILAPKQQQQLSTLHNKVNVEEGMYSSLHQKQQHLLQQQQQQQQLQQHQQQLQQQQQLVDQLSKDHSETLSQLNKAKSALAKQTVEITSLKGQISKSCFFKLLMWLIKCF